MDSRQPPSPKQAELLAYIRAYLAEHGYPPTLREMGKALGHTDSTTEGARDILKALERKGWVARDEGISRGVRVVPEPAESAA